LGRFGNQLFQYAFLRICAQNRGARIECSPWIGQTLFGHDDAPIAERLPRAIEYKELGECLFDRIPEFIPHLEKLAEAKSSRIDPEALDFGLGDAEMSICLHSKKPDQTLVYPCLSGLSEVSE
jgi:hypothetical protein